MPQIIQKRLKIVTNLSKSSVRCKNIDEPLKSLTYASNYSVIFENPILNL